MISYIFPYEEATHVHGCIIQEDDVSVSRGYSLVRCRCHVQAYTVIFKGNEYVCPVSGQRVIIT